MSRAVWGVAGALVVVAGTAAVALVGPFGTLPFGFGRESGAHASAAPKVPKTADVVKTTLVETKDIDGTLAYPEAVEIPSRLNGTVTSAPSEGSTISRGKSLFRVDNKPVVLMYGSQPAYRTLKDGVEGTDVEQFEKNLRALGYDGFTVDDEYSSYTADAVEEWQEDLGLDETGVVELGQIVFAPSSIRIAETKLDKGKPVHNGETVVTYTTGRREVTAELEVADQDLAKVGGKITVELPSGDTVNGVIREIGTTAASDSSEEESPGGNQAGQATEDAKIEITATISEQKKLGKLDQAPVTVELVSSERKEVLAVPLGALLALQEGGYGVEVVSGTKTSVVAVEVGMFAGGLVEVTSPDLQEGDKVGVPTS